MTPKPSEAEVAILQVLWDKQPCSVRTVHEDISAIKSVGYTTILKQLQRMHEKGLVTRSQGEGKSFNYSAAQPEEYTRNTLVGRLINTAFRGDVNELVMHALGNSKPTDEELDEIKAFISSLENK
ncbi:MAG TPA: BlaI/MecI/CopY family transcriptional regulator [Hellea balneolensis]|uniref:BlaI/MecI/CopY family transcriptional regulator n=1 Tax=Hellea balneolensis TaxID=287478 RepID=A0A7C5M423_9PROT|nr:BlaI/MecI/CopY family transcriptional regulator [Hellea balneolensis]